MAINNISKIAKDFVSLRSEEVVDIVTFCEAPWGLDFKLFPTQKFTLKCVSGDNIIIGHNGVPRTMRQFFHENNPTVTTYDDSDWKIKRVAHAGVTSSGIKKVYRLTTKNSKRWIETTSDHPILTPSGYKKLEDLKTGDTIVITSSEPFPEVTSNISDYEAGLLGLMIGDGSCANSSIGLVVANGQDSIEEYFKTNVLRVDNGLKFRERIGNGCKTIFTGRECGWNRHTKNKFAILLDENGILGKNCHNKNVPENIFKASKSAQSEFLKCLFATDGGVSVHKGKKIDGVTVMYTSCNYELICGIRILLQRFGVRTTVKELDRQTNFGKQSGWQIVISSTSEIKRFFREVGIPIDWGNRYADMWDILKNRNGSSHLDSLPQELRQEAKNARVRFFSTGGKIPNTAPGTVMANTTGKNMLKSLADWTKDSYIGKISNSDICWDKIESIEYVGEKDVYDIAVPHTHNFVIGGIVVHNCFYNLELDDTDPYIPVPDLLNEKILFRFTEKQFLKYLYEEGRSNTDSVSDKKFRELILVWGRRASKSSISACISSYEFYKLVKRGNPAAYYGQKPGQEIVILNVAPTDEQASSLLSMTKKLVLQCPYLRERSLHQPMDYFDLQTDWDKEQYGKPSCSLKCLAGGSSAAGLRGQNAIAIIMDEMAFFISKEGSRFSGEEVLNALKPSLAAFKNDGKMLMMSSPYAKYGTFYKSYLSSFDSPNSTLMFQMPTSMVNSKNVSSEFLREEYRKNKTKFMCEFGGEFSDKITAWIEDESDFRKNISNRGPNVRGKMEHQYFVGIDLGFIDDGLGYSIVHKENNKIVLDMADVWFPASSKVWELEDSIYHSCTRFKHRDKLRMSDIVDEIKGLQRWFNIKQGCFDQSNGYALAELFNNSGLKQIEMMHISDTIDSQMYELVKRLYGEGLLDLYDHPVLIPELLSLEAELVGKNKIIVDHPDKIGSHNDISDAFVRAVWLCYNFGINRNTNNIAVGARGIPQSNRGGASFFINRRKHLGVHPRGLDPSRLNRIY